MTSESQQPSRSDELFAAVQALSRDERKRFDLLVRQNDLAGKAMRRLRRWANGTRGEKRPPYIDCNRDAFRAWIEGQFKPGMSWENRREWHLDHIVPRSSFDLSNEEDLKRCFHWSNIQPLWASENCRKGAKPTPTRSGCRKDEICFETTRPPA
jgi:hypothetical protein